ncbi:uncharacterized protein N7483_011440 [Penicillium malachiteum]|uniref:uncharacterized protein n=1 Tax=Penicillium malachiteum TaxID=1324776 RepID=UPI002548E48A|nr:uncharacterized protein N7483_011440 [Penicillium malachiteum]KAJ5714259.1 hypothetical protein N7483_011440 [Penicillium malachiteum]
MTATLNFRLKSQEDDDPWLIEQNNFAIINDFLQPASHMSLTEAAFQINELTPIKREAWGEEDVEEPESYLREIWVFFTIICKQIPYQHPSQEKLVSLIRELTLLPSEEFNGWETAKARIWADLPFIGVCWWDEWDGTSDSCAFDPTEQGINFFALSARLLQSGFTGLPNWLTHSTTERWISFAIIALRYAFEERLSHEMYRTREWETQDYQICAAAQWIEHSREIIFQKAELEFLTREPEEPTKTADLPLYKWEGIVSRELWDYWEAGFRAFGGEKAEGISEETACVCRKAALHMAELSLTRDS